MKNRMFKQVCAIAVCAVLLTPYATAQSRSLMPGKEQAEDFTYYQSYNWDSSVERNALYDAIKNGQHHMYKKLRTCQAETLELDAWLNAFKSSSEEVKNTESAYGMLDMDDNEIRYPDDGDYVARWQTRDYAEKHFSKYSGENLTQLQDKYWVYCLENLPLKLFTREAEQRLEARIQTEMDRGAYP
uniref:hypothetical protein n=1 Tax=Rheinheimera sp. TaxID=1869214 RepID=UPI004047A9C1